MFKRKRIPKKVSKRMFRRGAMKVKRRNYAGTNMRGGIRM